MNVAQETLGFRRTGLSPVLSLLMSAFALPIPPASLTGHLLRPTERSSTICTKYISQASVMCLAPLHLPRRTTRPVSYYAFFKGWLLLSQLPGCLCLPTSFSTQHIIWDLSCGSGLFPSGRWTLAPTVCLPCSHFSVFGVCYGGVGLDDPPNHYSALPPRVIHEALPK